MTLDEYVKMVNSLVNFNLYLDNEFFNDLCEETYTSKIVKYEKPEVVRSTARIQFVNGSTISSISPMEPLVPITPIPTASTITIEQLKKKNKNIIEKVLDKLINMWYNIKVPKRSKKSINTTN